MDRRVETFLQAAQTGSFSETARRLFITQPAVTQQIASLGDELGVRLFEREGNRMVLTTPGRIAQRRYQRMCDEERALRQELSPWSARRSFTVGCPGGMIRYDRERYSQVLQIAMKHFPGAEVRSLELDNPEQHFRILADHEADAIVSGVEPARDAHGDAVSWHVLRSIHHYVVCRHDDPLAKKDVVELRDLAGKVVYTFESEAFSGNLLRALDGAEEPKPVLRRQQSLAGSLPLIQAGKGVTICAQNIPLPDDLLLVPLDFAPNIHIGLVWLKDVWPQTRAFESFVEEVAQLYLPERTQEKALRRTQMRQARAALPAEGRARQGADACARLLALPEVRAARVVAGYLAFGDELDVGGFLRGALADGHAVALPVTLCGPKLAFVRVSRTELDDPALLPRCLREPQRPLDALPTELEGRLVAPSDIDVAVLPGLAFDVHGTRLGYGGGYYDAWLGEAFGEPSGRRADGAAESTAHGKAQAQARKRPLLVGVGFDCQLLPPEASLPREPHDIPLDVVVTPGATLVVGEQAAGER